jgi:hypothetical protein
VRCAKTQTPFNIIAILKAGASPPPSKRKQKRTTTKQEGTKEGEGGVEGYKTTASLVGDYKKPFLNTPPSLPSVPRRPLSQLVPKACKTFDIRN